MTHALTMGMEVATTRAGQAYLEMMKTPRDKNVQHVLNMLLDGNETSIADAAGIVISEH